MFWWTSRSSSTTLSRILTSHLKSKRLTELRPSTSIASWRTTSISLRISVLWVHSRKNKTCTSHSCFWGSTLQSANGFFPTMLTSLHSKTNYSTSPSKTNFRLISNWVKVAWPRLSITLLLRKLKRSTAITSFRRLWKKLSKWDWIHLLFSQWLKTKMMISLSKLRPLGTPPWCRKSLQIGKSVRKRHVCQSFKKTKKVQDQSHLKRTLRSSRRKKTRRSLKDLMKTSRPWEWKSTNLLSKTILCLGLCSSIIPSLLTLEGIFKGAKTWPNKWKELNLLRKDKLK